MRAQECDTGSGSATLEVGGLQGISRRRPTRIEISLKSTTAKAQGFARSRGSRTTFCSPPPSLYPRSAGYFPVMLCKHGHDGLPLVIAVILPSRETRLPFLLRVSPTIGIPPNPGQYPVPVAGACHLTVQWSSLQCTPVAQGVVPRIVYASGWSSAYKPPSSPRLAWLDPMT